MNMIDDAIYKENVCILRIHRIFFVKQSKYPFYFQLPSRVCFAQCSTSRLAHIQHYNITTLRHLKPFFEPVRKKVRSEKRSPAKAQILKDLSPWQPAGRRLGQSASDSRRNPHMTKAADPADGQAARIINYRRNPVDLFSNRFEKRFHFPI